MHLRDSFARIVSSFNLSLLQSLVRSLFSEVFFFDLGNQELLEVFDCSSLVLLGYSERFNFVLLKIQVEVSVAYVLQLEKPYLVVVKVVSKLLDVRLMHTHLVPMSKSTIFTKKNSVKDGNMRTLSSSAIYTASIITCCQEDIEKALVSEVSCEIGLSLNRFSLDQFYCLWLNFCFSVRVGVLDIGVINGD